MKNCLVLGLSGWLGLVLGGCSSSGGSPAASACSTSSLAVTVTGLPAGAHANVTVTGMAGSTQSVSATQSLKLATDSYTIAAETVTLPDPIVRSVYTASVDTPTAAVVCGGTAASATVTYTLVPTSNKFWIGSQNSDSDTLGYASASLAVTGTPAADIAASTAGSLPGAFDRDGNLWVIDGTAGAIGLKRYPAATLSTGGTKTPDVTVSGEAINDGTPGPVSIAFDGSGDLWVGVGYSGQVVEFAAAQLAASSDSVLPMVEISAVPAPNALAFDGKGNLWVGSGNEVIEYLAAHLTTSNNNAPDVTIDAQTPAPVVGPLSSVLGLAFTADDQLWVNYDGTLALLTSLVSGTVTPAIQIRADVLTLPEGIALDEGGGLWMAGGAGEIIEFGASQLKASGSPSPQVVITSSSVGSATSPALFPAPAGLPLYSSLQ
jgi:hypothetical protein